MCGVIGYIGNAGATPEFFYTGLKRLEYRGYDSTGIAMLGENSPVIIRAEGKLSELQKKLHLLPEKTQLGIGHTRWATHGKPSLENAHPHQSGQFILLHNGIIENYKALKDFLLTQGYEFKSETDTEVAAHLLHYEYNKIKNLDPAVTPRDDKIPVVTPRDDAGILSSRGVTAGSSEENVKSALFSVLKQIRGTFALAILCIDTPDTLYAVKLASPLIIGKGKSENYIASGITAFVDHTKEIIVLEDRDVAILKKNSIEIVNFENKPQSRSVKTIEWTSDLLEKNGFAHFMLKEIHESPRAVAQTIISRLNRDTGRINLQSYGIAHLNFEKIDRIQIIACGTSYYAGLLGKSYLEKWTKLPVEVDIASEYRYRTCTATENTLIVAISQSGETIDTLQAIKHARENEAMTLAIVNMPQSTIAHNSHAESLIYAGPEIGVASTKAFSAQVSSLIVLALALAQEKGRRTQSEIFAAINTLVTVPTLMDSVLQLSSQISVLSEKFVHTENMLYTGRGLQWPIAMEGALKLKEISYIHAEGYPSGELKHGPIALIDKNMTVVTLAPRDELYEKNISNIQEIKARSGKILAIGMEDDIELKGLSEDFIGIPNVSEFIQPFLTTIVVHLLAYWIAVKRGHDIDQPRNLAKSVTVE